MKPTSQLPTRNLLRPNGTRIATREERAMFRNRMRANPTPEEQRFAERMTEAGIAFRQQAGLGFYIGDFLIPDRLLNIEIDGGYHGDPSQQTKDQKRDAFLEEVGFHVLRVKNEEVEDWPLEYIMLFPVVPHQVYLSTVGRMGKMKNAIARNEFLFVTPNEQKRICRHLGIPLDTQLTQEQVRDYRAKHPRKPRPRKKHRKHHR